MKFKKLRVNNVELNIYVFLNEIQKQKRELINEILSEINENKKIGFAGWKSKEGLKENLNFNIKEAEIQKSNIDPKVLLGEVKDVLEKASLYLEEELFIYIFPTNSVFIKEKLKGVTGFCPWRNTIYIYIHPKSNLKDVKKVLVHELAHSLSEYYSLNTNIGEGLIMEGLAENFVEKIMKKPDNTIVGAIQEKEIKKIFSEIKNILKERDYDKYSEVFYGTGKYPCWAGYSIGYYLVKKYLKSKTEVNWNKLLRENPETILNKALKLIK